MVGAQIGSLSGIRCAKTHGMKPRAHCPKKGDARWKPKMGVEEGNWKVLERKGLGISFVLEFARMSHGDTVRLRAARDRLVRE